MNYLTEIDKQAQERSHRLIEDMKHAQGITEQLKAKNTTCIEGQMRPFGDR